MKLNTYKMLLLLLVVLAFAACRKAEGPDMNYYLPNPENLTLNAGKTALHATWAYSGNENSGFLVQVAYDANFVTILKTDTVGPEINEADFTGLGYFSEVYVRVRTLSKNIVLHSGFTKASLKPESVFKAILKTELTYTSAILRWNAPSSGTLSSVLIIDNLKKTERTIQLSAQQVSSQSLSVDGLESAGNYTVVIFAGDDRKGVITFNVPDINATVTIEGSPVIYETLQMAINAATSGSIINMGAAKHEYSSAELETVNITGKSLTIRAKPGSTMVPEITMKNFWVKGAVSSLKLSGIKIISTSKLNTTTTNFDYNKHIIGISYVTGIINVVVENCDLSGAESGLIFTQTPGTANLPEGALNPATINLTVDNCIMHDFGNAGGDFIDFRSGTLDQIKVKNSTFSNGARAFLRNEATAPVVPANSITIENCTFYNYCNGGAFLKIASPGSNVLVTKCILMNKLSATNNSIAGAGTVVKLTTNNISGGFATNAQSNPTAANNTGITALDPTFADAVKSIFTVGNATVKAAGLGDPRWLK